MIHVDSVTAALFARLSGDPVLVSSGFTIQEGETLNRDLNLTPWVGIYCGNLSVNPQTIGGDQPWQGQLDLFLYVQQGGHRSGQETTRMLELAQARVLDVINQDKTLGGTVLMLSSMEVNPFQRDIMADSWLFTNEIALKAVLRA